MAYNFDRFPIVYTVTSRMAAFRLPPYVGDHHRITLEPGTHVRVTNYSKGFKYHTGYILDAAGKVNLREPLRIYDLELHAEEPPPLTNIPVLRSNATRRTRRHRTHRAHKNRSRKSRRNSRNSRR